MGSIRDQNIELLMTLVLNIVIKCVLATLHVTFNTKLILTKLLDLPDNFKIQ